MAADWSGALSDEHRHLWLAVWDPDAALVTSVRGMTRAEAGAAIITLAERDPRLIAGLDFCFSLPAWWLDANGIATATELWADPDRLERWLAECAPPFWGRPGHRRPDLGGGRSQWRKTELTAPVRPRSAFQIGGAGAVGTASLRGMPTLHLLRRAGLSVWPFAQWRQPAVVEVWPRLAIGRTVKSSSSARAEWLLSRRARLHPEVRRAAAASPDAFDAVAAALALAERGATPRPDDPDPLARREGWIDGVEAPAP